MTSNRAKTYRQLLAERVGKPGYAREAAVLRFLIGGDDLDRYIARRSLTDEGFAEAMNRV
jgi:hypothetical protein